MDHSWCVLGKGMKEGQERKKREGRKTISDGRACCNKQREKRIKMGERVFDK